MWQTIALKVKPFSFERTEDQHGADLGTEGGGLVNKGLGSGRADLCMRRGSVPWFHEPKAMHHVLGCCTGSLTLVG